jgi:hypothetical protein
MCNFDIFGKIKNISSTVAEQGVLPPGAKYINYERKNTPVKVFARGSHPLAHPFAPPLHSS